MNAEVEATQSSWAMPQELPEGEHNESNSEYLYLDEIVTDGGTQSRAVLNQEVIASYAQKIQSGSQFPPVDVYYDGERYWLADGFHRVAAYKKLKIDFSWKKKITVKIHQGTRRDAVLHSVGANDNHGLQRSNADKQRAILTLLQDAEWGGWSNREIARACRVDEKTVRNIRKTIAPVTADIRSDIPETSSFTRTYKTKHGKITQMQVDSIGGKRYPTNDLTLAENFSSVSSEDSNARLQKKQDVNTVDNQAAMTVFSTGTLVTIAPTHPLSGSTVAIAELIDRERAVVELPNGSREHILLKDLQLYSSSEIQQQEFLVPEEIDRANSESTSPFRSTKLIGQPAIAANFSLCQIVCEISVALIACIESLPSDLLQKLAGAIEIELGSRSASNQPVENSEAINN